ncbi:GNAT family N-acetyltransferase [Pseudomonas sp. Marseille-QA0892]
MHLFEPETPRLRLRQWRAADYPSLAELNADREVMRYFPRRLTKVESDAMADRCATLIGEKGWGFWAVETKADGGFIGFVGLHEPTVTLPFSPCVEIGWRLHRRSWGQGYATEAAQAALRVGFDALAVAEIVSFTALNNRRSRAVMERLGMVEDSLTFSHPSVPDDSPLRVHCLYRLSRERWESLQAPDALG